MSSPRITAVVCTYNRKDYLRRAVGSLLNQSLPRNEFEILVVDNGSTDGTPQTISEIRKSDPAVRYVVEPLLGVSHARNTGWRQATGKYVAYLDDDEIAAPDWLEKILTVFNIAPEKAACVGGKEVLLWECARPNWVPDRVLYYLGQLDLSDKLMRIEGPSWLGGGNSAFPRDILEEFGGFNARFGRKGKSLLSMEDTLIQQQLVAAGRAIYYHPDIVIQNTVPADRLTQQWFKKRAWWEGISLAFATQLADVTDLFKIADKCFRAGASILLKPKRTYALFATTDNSDIFYQKCIAWSCLGYLYGIFLRMFGRQP